MALTLTGGSGADISGYGAADSGSYRDVFGFDNAPDSTNLPQIYEREVTIYGNRTLMGFLRMIGSEEPTNSQQVRWAEQRRLHVFYNRVRGVVSGTVFTPSLTTGFFAIYANDDVVVQGTDILGTVGIGSHAIRVNDKVLIGRTGNSNAAELAIVTGINETTGVVQVEAYSGATATAFASLLPDTDGTGTGGGPDTLGTNASDLSILVIGTEVAKTSGSRDKIIQPEYDTYTNSTVIMRDTYGVNGTDANQIGWVEIADENGVQGKYWYLKGKSETMTRWNDYLETSMLEDRFKQSTGTRGKGDVAGRDGVTQNGGSEGLFAAIEDRGNVSTGGFATANNTFLDDLDKIVNVLDKEGNIEENLFYLNRAQSLNFDDGMAAQNNEYATGTAWGMFNNSEKMGLSLGFSSVRRGSYDFYKKDWKYLNQLDGRGSFGGIEGISVPMGTKSVYDQYGANLQSPFATINYLAAPHHSRQNMSWAHGGLAPTPTSGIDELRLEFLTERCICLKGANNFILFR